MEPGQFVTKRLIGGLDPEQRELAGGTIQGRDAVVMRPQANRDRIVGAAAVEVGILHHGAGGQHPDHLSPHQAAGGAGRLDLVAEGDLDAGLEQLPDVAFEGVVGHAGHGQPLPFAELARGERDA